MQNKPIPQAGQVVLVESVAAPARAGHPGRLRISGPVETIGPTTPGSPQWWLLTGWWLGPDDEPLCQCTMPVRADAVQLVPDTPVPYQQNP